MIPSIDAIQAALQRFGVRVAVPPAAIEAALADGDEGAAGAVDVAAVDVDRAVREVVAMARQLAALPPPTKKDDIGYAAITDRPMRNYLAYVATHPDDVPLDYHLRAATMLGLHKHTQLGTERVENAIATLRAAVVARGIALPPEKGEGRYRIYAPDEGRKLPDGSSYSYNAKTGIARFTLPKRQDGTRVNDLLNKGDVPRGATSWDNTPGSVVRNDLVVPRVHIPRVIAAIRNHYPDLADAVDHLAGAWKLPTASSADGRGAGAGAGAVGGSGGGAAGGGGPTPSGRSDPGTRAEPAREREEEAPVGWEGNRDGVYWQGSAEAGELAFTFTRPHGITRDYMNSTPLGQAASWRKVGEEYKLVFRLPTVTLDVRKALGNKSPVAATVLGQLVALALAVRQEAQAELAGDAGAETRRIIRLIGWMMAAELRERFAADGVPPAVIAAVRTTKVGDVSGTAGTITWSIDPDDVHLTLRGLPYVERKKVEALVKSASGYAGIDGQWALRVGIKHTPGLARALDELGHYATAAQLRIALLVDGTVAVCIELEELATAFTIDQIDNEKARGWVREVDAKLRAALAPGMVMFPYQTIGVTYARAAGYRCLIADEMGLGKTAQAIGAVAIDPKKLLPAIVICPGSVIYNWKREFSRFYPRARVLVHDKPGPLPDKSRADVVVLSWDRMRLQQESVRTWGAQLVIADEVHSAKNTGSQRTQALHTIAEEVPYIIELSGTPMPNRPIELYSLLHMLDPVAFPTEKDFGVRYANAARRRVTMRHPATGQEITREFWDDRGSSNIDELRDRLRCSMIRRNKDEVAKDLPPLMFVPAPVLMNAEESAEYNRILQEWVKDFIGEKETVGKTRAEIYKALMAGGLIKAGKLRRYLGGVKARYAIEDADTFLREQGRRLLIFCEHDEVVQTIRAGLEERSWRVETVQGDSSPTRKQKVADAFTRGEYDVLIGTRAIAEGMNLQGAASDALCVEYWWSPKDFDQATARLHRYGQTNTVWVRMLRAEGTYDEYIEDVILAEKRRVNAALLGKKPDAGIIA